MRLRRQNFREAIAKAAQGASEAKGSLVRALVPDIESAPTGTVTLGDKAGAFGSWLVHDSVAKAADKISEAVVEYLARTHARDVRLLVVDDRALLSGAVTALLVRARLDRVTMRLEPLAALLEEAEADLTSAVTEYELAAPAPTADEGGGEGVDSGETTVEAATPSAGVVGASLGSANDLFSLLRTDYTVTAVQVTTSPSELATLTAAKLSLAREGLTVEIDGFTAANGSAILRTANSVTSTRDTVQSKLAVVEARLAPVEAELTALRARINHLEEAWATWATAADRSADGGDLFRTKIDKLYATVTPRAKAAGPARAKADEARAILNEVDTGLNALLQASSTADPPLLTAIRWERLRSNAGASQIDYVLYVGTDQVAADSVTRKSLLGTSGRIAFLGTANVSWLLMQPGRGIVRAGGPVPGAMRLRLDLESGKSELASLIPGGELDKDPLRKLETAASVGVVAIAAFLCILAIVAALRLALG